jgi:hypothetical protein
MRRILFLDLPITAVLLVALIIFSDFTDGWWEGNISRLQWLALDTIFQTLIALLAAAPLLNLPAFKRKTHLWLLALYGGDYRARPGSLSVCRVISIGRCAFNAGPPAIS